ncbi:MAG: hypothetical protein ACTSQ7_04645 [Alphaproteobacteria bacterium]
MEILPLSGPLGAEVRGLDPAQALDRAALTGVRAVMGMHEVVAFRNPPDLAMDLANLARLPKSMLGAQLQPHCYVVWAAAAPHDGRDRRECPGCHS